VEIKRDQNQREMRILSDAGRILRPLLVVSNLLKIKGSKSEHKSFWSLLHSGVIAEEEEDFKTAWGVQYLFGKEGKSSVKYTHCELDMLFLSRRVLYQSQKHSSQAIGFSTTNPNLRVDALSHQLFYPQRPLFQTTTSDCLG
jgi:DNA-directed RNA polymerase IV and V subunit 2